LKPAEDLLCLVLIVGGYLLHGFIDEDWKSNFNASWRLKNILLPLNEKAEPLLILLKKLWSKQYSDPAQKQLYEAEARQRKSNTGPVHLHRDSSCLKPYLSAGTSMYLSLKLDLSAGRSTISVLHIVTNLELQNHRSIERYSNHEPSQGPRLSNDAIKKMIFFIDIHNINQGT
jgi:hypothetical protein